MQAGMAQVITADSTQTSAPALTEPLITVLSADTDSLALDSLAIPMPTKRQSTLDYEVNYQCDDSMRVDLDSQMVFLYGNAIATYGDIELKAAYIEIALKSTELLAHGLPDSTGEIIGHPVFRQGDQEFVSRGTMRYNFKSKRGLIQTVKTQQGDGYLHAEVVKKDTGDIIYAAGGKYTTCAYDDPHFHIHASRLKVINKDKIIAGPSHLRIEGIPTPLVLPFGIFPNSDRRSSGLIIPSYGAAVNRGLSLDGGGYYFGFSDRFDLAITGDIFTRGSWNLYGDAGYAQRYRYRGNVGLDLIKYKYSEEGYPDYVSAPLAYKITWSHKQDSKARPGVNFGAQVDFGSPRADRINQNSTTTNYLRSNVKSNISYSKQFLNTPFIFALSASSDQNVQQNVINMKLPDASLTMSRIYPFRKKVRVGKEGPLEKIGLTSGVFLENRISAGADTFFTENTLRDMNNGVRANVSLQSSYKLLKYIQVAPTFSNDFKGTAQLYNKSMVLDTSGKYNLVTREINQMDGFWEGAFRVSLSTVAYGLYRYKNNVVRAMRHQITPSVSFSVKPDYSDPMWGYYTTYTDFNTQEEVSYSKFTGSVVGAPESQGNGVASFSLQNTFELKVRDRTDSTGTGDKKIRLVDGFGFNTSYAMAKDSLRWSPLSINLRTTAVKGFTLLASANMDPYARNTRNGERINEYIFDRAGGKRLGTFSDANLNINWRLSPKSSKKEEKRKTDEMLEQGLYYTDFVDFSIPWTANVEYSLRWSKNVFSPAITSHNLNVRGSVNLTQNWRVESRLGYDFVREDFTFPNFTIYRNLHCWEFTLQVTPFGERQSYMFTINVKSGTLSDALKIPRNRNYNLPVRD